MTQEIDYEALNQFFAPRPRIIDAENKRRFIPPHDGARPLDLFQIQTNRCTIPAPRYIRHGDSGTMLMFIDGCALGNGTATARAGFGVVFRAQGNIQARLERPPDDQAATSNRAELRAAICALQLRYWKGEGFVRIILATDSEYVVLGACERVARWRRNGWRTNAGTPVKNKDLWEILVSELERWEGQGVSVQFWRIPRVLNAAADKLAKDGAEIREEPPVFTEIAAFDISLSPSREKEHEENAVEHTGLAIAECPGVSIAA